VNKQGSGPCNSSWLNVPLWWDTPSALGVLREVQVQGKKATPSSVLRCQALNFAADGTLASQSALTTIDSTSYTHVSLFLNYVPFGSYGFVRCDMSNDGATLVVNLDYLP